MGGIDMSEYLENEIFVCDCNDISHQFVLSVSNFGDGNPSLEAYIKLNIFQPWYKRISIALKYLFKIDNQYQFSNLILTNSVNSLQNSLEKFKKLQEKELIENYKF